MKIHTCTAHIYASRPQRFIEQMLYTYISGAAEGESGEKEYRARHYTILYDDGDTEQYNTRIENNK